jgi:hypothetical protein
MEAQEKNKHKHVLEENLVGIGDTLHFDLWGIPLNFETWSLYC